MRNICVIGNSHISAVKLGWDALQQDFPDVKLSFFGGPRGSMNDAIVSDGRIVAATEELREFFVRTSGDRDSIDANYDEYLLCGLQFSIQQMRDLLTDYRAEYQHIDERTPLSDGCFFESMLGLLRTKLAMQILAKVHEISGAPVSVMHQPMPSMDDTKSVAAFLRDIGDDTYVSKVFFSASMTLAKELNFKLLPQPKKTLRTPLHSRRRFATGAVRMRAMHEEGEREQVREKDVNHMNPEYGALVLRSYLLGETETVD